MDDELRALERAVEADGSPTSVVACAHALVRAGRASEVEPLVLARPAERLMALEARQLSSLTNGPAHTGVMPLTAWQLPAHAGGLVFVQLVRLGRVRWGIVRATDVIELARTVFGGEWHGQNIVVRLRRGARCQDLLQVSCEDSAPERAERVEEFARLVASAAGARIEDRCDDIRFLD